MTDFKTRLLDKNKYFNNCQPESGLKTRALKGAGATIFSQITIYGVQMIGTVVLARKLTPNDFGLVAMVTAFSFLLQNLGSRGFTEATIQSDVINHQKISTLFWIHVALSIAVTLLFIGLAPLIAWFYKDPRLVPITIVIALSFVFPALSTQHLALLTRNMQFYRITANEIAAAIISTIVAITLACLGSGHWALVARRIAPLVSLAVGAWVLCQWMPGLPARGTGVRSMLRFGMNTYGNYATNYFSRNLDKVLIGWRHGAQSLGYYERAYYLFVMPVGQLSYPLTNVAVAALSRLRHDPDKYRSYYLKAVSMLALIGMPLSAILTLVGKDLLVVLLGPQWNRAGEIFSVFGPSVGILLLYGTHGWLHLSLGRADRWFRWGIIELVITGLCFAIALPFGALGVATAYAACFYILMVPGILYAGKPIHLRFSSLASVIWQYYVSALAAGSVCWFMLYSLDVTSAMFLELGILPRIFMASALCLSVYIPLVIVCHQGKEPLSQFVSFLKDMLPNTGSKTSGTGGFDPIRP